MKYDPTLVAPTPVIAAALKRRSIRRARRVDRQAKGGGGCKKSADNYVAKSPLTAGQNTGNRPGAGAPSGNRNASRHGYASAAAKARDKLIKARFRELDRAIDLIVPIWRSGGDVDAQCARTLALVRGLEAP